MSHSRESSNIYLLKYCPNTFNLRNKNIQYLFFNEILVLVEILLYPQQQRHFFVWNVVEEHLENHPKALAVLAFFSQLSHIILRPSRAIFKDDCECC